MLYLLITTCLIKDIHYNRRIEQYISSLYNTIDIFNKNFNNIKMIIIENNNNTKTFLDDFDIEVFYTDTNISINSNNKGIKELTDILKCIEKYNIQDDDLIIKLTGRYLIKNDSIFIKSIKKNLDIDCIIRYGNYMDKNNKSKNDCITGLIGMKCKYIKMIEMPKEDECVEWKWAKASSHIDKNKLIELEELGIYMCPSSYYEYITI